MSTATTKKTATKKGCFFETKKGEKSFFWEKNLPEKKTFQKKRFFLDEKKSKSLADVVDDVVDESLAGLEEVVKDSMQMMSADHLIESRVVTTVYF